MQDFKTRVLLVEDEELARKTLAFYLNTIFDEVVLASDGSIALDILKNNLQKENLFDLIITDLNMPNVNGMQMIDEILKIVPNQRFIVVSAYKNEEDLLKLINLRISGYFVKPLNIDNMMEMLQKLLYWKMAVFSSYTSRKPNQTLWWVICSSEKSKNWRPI